MEIETISINDLLKQYDKQLDDSVIKLNDVIIVPHTRLSSDDVIIIKRMRANNKKVHIPDAEQVQYQEFRGGEFELALIMIVNQTAIPILTNIVSSWIYDKVKGYSAKEKTKNDNLNIPPFKLEFYITKDKKYIKLEGQADDVLKGLDKIKKDYVDTT